MGLNERGYLLAARPRERVVRGNTSGRAPQMPLALTVNAQETLNYWKQLTHVLKYFRAEEDPKARLPKTFIQSFIEVCENVTLRPSRLANRNLPQGRN